MFKYINFVTAGVWLLTLCVFVTNDCQLNATTNTIGLVMLVGSYTYHGLRDLKDKK